VAASAAAVSGRVTGKAGKAGRCGICLSEFLSAPRLRSDGRGKPKW